MNERDISLEIWQRSQRISESLQTERALFEMIRRDSLKRLERSQASLQSAQDSLERDTAALKRSLALLESVRSE